MSALVPVYRRRASALHAARAGASASFCCALALVAVLYDNPIVLGGALAAVLAAGAGAGGARELRRTALLALGLAVLVIAINALVTSNGLTVLVGAAPSWGAAGTSRSRRSPTAAWPLFACWCWCWRSGCSRPWWTRTSCCGCCAA